MSRETEIEAYRKRWEAGDFRALIDGFEHFHNWNEPLPDWIAGPVHFALTLAFETGGAPGKGKTGGFAKRAERLDRDRWRWLAASSCIARTDEALEPARAMLAGTPHRGSIAAIRASYYRFKKLLQNSG